MKRIFLAITLVAFTASCSSIINRAVDRSVDRAANRVGERVGDAIAADLLAKNPQLFYAYTMSVFNLMFYQNRF